MDQNIFPGYDNHTCSNCNIIVKVDKDFKPIEHECREKSKVRVRSASQDSGENVKKCQKV